MLKTLFKIIGILLLMAVGIGTYFYLTINDYQIEGEITFSSLSAPAKVFRDDLMIPYIEAENMADALQVQGFIVAQERTYQIQLYRLLALGRLAEVFGQRAHKSDVLIRMVDINGLAQRQADALDENAKSYYQNYVQGINTYLQDYQHEHPFEVSLLGFNPETWTLQDIVAIQIFQSWANGSAWKTDLINLQLIDEVGRERAQQIAQVSINPEDESRTEATLRETAKFESTKTAADDLALLTLEMFEHLPNSLSAGSNAWATGSRLSSNGLPILANNPHLPAITLPGFWLPMAIFTPELTAAGVSAPGSPGIGVGRNQHIAWGATVGGSDGADIYIEQLDPNLDDHYLEGEDSLPLAIRLSQIKIKDNDVDGGFRTETLKIRSTKRGPLISDHAVGYSGERALSLRWAASQTINNSLGSDRLLYAKNIRQAEQAMRLFPGALSHIAIDQTGGIARVSSGRVPIRSSGDGSVPIDIRSLAKSKYENWQGLISSNEMPKQINPTRDWVGTANQRVIEQGYPYQYSKSFASSFRYRRIKEFFELKEEVDVGDHWALINDIKNHMAEALTPLYVRSLLKNYPEIARELQEWNYTDSPNLAAPAIFQVITKHLAQLTFADELSVDLWKQIFDTPYFWQERMVEMLANNKHPWFDNVDTEQVEDRDSILAAAMDAAIKELESELGGDLSDWSWGDLHTITFHSPVIPGKAAAYFLGGGTHPMYGSGETLNRSAYKPSQSYDTVINDSVRLVVDLSDDEKVLVVTPGGVSARYFDKSMKNQIDKWMAMERNLVWFDKKLVQRNAVSQLHFRP